MCQGNRQKQREYEFPPARPRPHAPQSRPEQRCAQVHLHQGSVTTILAILTFYCGGLCFVGWDALACCSPWAAVSLWAISTTWNLVRMCLEHLHWKNGCLHFHCLLCFWTEKGRKKILKWEERPKKACWMSYVFFLKMKTKREKRHHVSGKSPREPWKNTLKSTHLGSNILNSAAFRNGLSRPHRLSKASRNRYFCRGNSSAWKGLSFTDSHEEVKQSF